MIISNDQTNRIVRLGGVSVPRAIGILVVAVAIVVISEWTFGIRILARLSPTDSSMKFNTSVIFLLYGLSLWLLSSSKILWQRTAWILTAFATLIALLTLFQYVFGVNLGIDELVFKDHPNADITSNPGRMSPLVAANFLLIGTALMLWRIIDRSGVRPAEYFGIAAMVIPVVAVLGYLFSASSLYSFATVTGVALISAVLFLILLVGVLAVRSETGIVTILLSPTRAGFVLRFLLPTSVLAIVSLDWLSMRAARAGVISENVVLPLGTLASGGLISLLIWRCASLLYEADLKEKRTLAELQDALDAAEEANRAKDDFISIVSHELRTPLSTILGWLKVVQTKPSEENTRRALEIISRQSQTQLKLIEDLLDTSRIITGKMHLEIKPFDLEKIVEEATETIRPAADAKNIELVYEKPVELPAIACDGDRLRQVFWNLLSNAVKFTPAGGVVKIRLRLEAGLIKIEVTDTGEGIEESFLPFIFDRFRQADNSPSRRSGGVGLGLSLVRTITELHGGEVYAESGGRGRGTTFTVKLPLREIC